VCVCVKKRNWAQTASGISTTCCVLPLHQV
jgi:hypothetical protein